MSRLDLPLLLPEVLPAAASWLPMLLRSELDAGCLPKLHMEPSDLRSGDAPAAASPDDAMGAAAAPKELLSSSRLLGLLRLPAEGLNAEAAAAAAAAPGMMCRCS